MSADLRSDLIAITSRWLDHARSLILNDHASHRSFGAALAQRTVARIILARNTTSDPAVMVTAISRAIGLQLASLPATDIAPDIATGWATALDQCRGTLDDLVAAYEQTERLAGRLPIIVDDLHGARLDGVRREAALDEATP